MSDAGPAHMLDDYLADLLGRDAGTVPCVDGTVSVAPGGDEVDVLVFEGPIVGFAVARTHAWAHRPAGGRVTEVVTDLPWLIGAVEFDGASSWLVDCARLLSPDATPTAARYWLPIGDGSVALVLATEPEPQRLPASEIVWRGPAGRRPWLAGTASVSRRVLLDPDGLARLCAARAG